jgi:ribosomal protein S18 acetylase RimI-like enzyme
MNAADIEAIERATVAAVAPDAVEEIPGWLLPFDAGLVRRARSAAPTSQLAPDPAALAWIETRYRGRGLAPMFRLPAVPTFDAMRARLLEAGYRSELPTEVQVAVAAAVRAVSRDALAEVATAPDAGWTEVFLGPGFDPVEGASRVQTLSRASRSLFASVWEDGRTVAAGAAAFGHGWASVHGMRTAQDGRGRGLAGRVLAALAKEALVRGYERMFLQVQADNPAAQSLYRRAGFSLAWRYDYWSQPA